MKSGNDIDILREISRVADKLSRNVPSMYQRTGGHAPTALEIDAFKGRDEYIYAVADCHHFLERAVEKAHEAVALLPKPVYQRA